MCFFCLTPLRLECSRIRKTTSFLTELREWSENIVNIENHQRKVEGRLGVFISYLSEMKIVSVFYNSTLFQYFLQLVSTILCFGDV